MTKFNRLSFSHPRQQKKNKRDSVAPLGITRQEKRKRKLFVREEGGKGGRTGRRKKPKANDRLSAQRTLAVADSVKKGEKSGEKRAGNHRCPPLKREGCPRNEKRESSREPS